MSATCRSCGAPVIWAVTAATGSRMPVDAEPDEDGNLLLSLDNPPVAQVVDPAQLVMDDGKRFTSHFATCPHADQHRRPSHAR